VNIDEILTETFTDNEHLTPDAAEVLRNIRAELDRGQRQHPTRFAPILAAAVIVVLASIIVVVVDREVPDSASNQARASGVATAASPGPTPKTAPITLDPSVKDTFEPRALSDAPTGALSTDGAWQKYVSRLGSSQQSPPPNFTVQYGLLSIPVTRFGPRSSWTYSTKDQPSYGYSAPTGCLGGTASKCVEWIFLDIYTGHQIEETWQPVK
jgi:hypothetical protein